MNSRNIPLAVLLIILITPISQVSAIPTFYGGYVNIEGLWMRLLNTNTSIFWSQGDFFHYPHEGEALDLLADNGIKVNFRLAWWHKFKNGEIAWNSSVVDFCYNETLLGMLNDYIDNEFTYFDPEKLWAVTISEEEPMHAQEFFFTLEAFKKYNETYHSETGFWLRESLHGTMNITEEVAFYNWFNEKVIDFFNYIYDYIKGKWPHLLIFQFMGMIPGAPPVYGASTHIVDLKADAYMADLYYYDVYDNPFWLYEFVRNFKRAFPNKEFHIHLWGEESWPNGGLAGGFEHIRRNAWITYLAGADAIGWFNWHYEKGTMWERDDALGKRYFLYTHRINGELGKLPVFAPEPQVLAIREAPLSFQAGLCVDLGLFNEWDVVSQKNLLASNMNLSQYNLVVVSEGFYYDEVVEILNDFVKNGGNIVILGGFGFEQNDNVYGNATRTTRFLLEEGTEQIHHWGNTTINITQPNPLGLDLQYEHIKSSIFALSKDTLTENHQEIGEFIFTYDNGTIGPLEDSPLVLYHNISNPEEGWMLYWGPWLSNTEYDPAYEDVVDTFLPEWNYSRYLYRTITKAFASNFLHLNVSISTASLEYVLMTQSKLENGTILAGISNFHSETKNINYTLDLPQYSLQDGLYWVHSLSSNNSLGWYESNEQVLMVPLSIPANGTELLLISAEQFEPSYSVDIFPNIPTEQEVENLWPVTTPTTTTTTTTTTSESTTTTSEIPTTTTSGAIDFDSLIGLILISGGGVCIILVIVVTLRKKKK